MTFGVPYSFVPGTKAKADEVNANFIHVLSKIEDTNTRIDETNSNAESTNAEIAEKITQVEEKVEQRVDLDFSNISDIARSMFDAKANVADIDGNWAWYSLMFAGDYVLSNSNATTFSLANYLPNDGKIYEVLFDIAGESSSYGFFIFSTDYTSFYCFRAKGHHYAQVLTVPIGPNRVITFSPSSSNVSGTTKMTLHARGYRKVR